MPKNWKIHQGNARASLYPEGPNGEVWVPRDDANEFDDGPFSGPTVRQVERIKGVEECGSCGAQSYHVIVEADSVDKLPKAVAHVKRVLEGYFARSIRRKPVTGH